MSAKAKSRLLYAIKKRKTILRRKRKKMLVKRINHIFLTLSLSSFFITVLLSSFLLSYLQFRISAIPSAEEVFTTPEYATEIYDRNGTSLYRLHGDDSNRDEIKTKEVTDLIRATYLAAEDADFYNHKGISTEAITKCAFRNVVEENKKCGGSTITQQVVKIKTQKNDPTFERKVDEVFTSTKVEEVYSKDEIFLMYLNITPYGANITGIKTAADFYYGITDPTKLSLAQIVSLSAMINDPVKLSPTLSDDRETAAKLLEIRRQYVFDQLIEKLDKINTQLANITPIDQTYTPLTIEQINAARAVTVSYNPPKYENAKAGHFVNYTLNQLQSRGYKNGEPFTLDDLQNGGYRIYTSLDYNLQQVAERYADWAGNNYKYWNVYNAAVMTTRPSTGEIITMAGSRNFYGQSEACDAEGNNCKYNPQVNVLTSLQSPGSTNKPLAYFMAYDRSIVSPGSFLPDIPIKFGEYTPKNWDDRFLGPYQTARDMLRQSRNIPALILMEAIGTENYINTARSFGYTTYQDASQYGQSLVLGGGDVYPVEHAQAYGVFANQGYLVKLNPIKKILDKDGNVIYEAKPEPIAVADAAATYMLNQTLMNLDVGTGETIAWDNRDVAGKTGTTENNKDSFLLMYSPDFVTLGWAGNNNNDLLDFNYGWPAFVVTPWLKSYMAEIGNSEYFSARTPFVNPGNVYQGGGFCSGALCLGLRYDWLIQGREPSWTNTSRMPAPSLQSFLDQYYRGGKI